MPIYIGRQTIDRKVGREMIIKFAHGKGEFETWEVFGDIDHYSFCQHFPLPVKDILVDRLDFTEDENENKRWDILFFSKNMTEATEIVAHSPIFILNDEGRTVDKI
jgi:hypothetical protein